MAENSVIGALRVDLGLDSAQFMKGLKQAETGLGAFGKSSALALTALTAAAVSAAGAIALAVKGSIDHADALSKAAQKAGVTTEALSRLEYAGKFADVSLEDLSGSLGKLSKSMLDAAQNSGSTTAIAFKALGISIRDVAGNLKGSDEVFSEVADRFARMQDGATKTALAMQIFGKSGAMLIPLLNEGADGLKRFADESDRTGNTITTETGKAAEEFNDNLTALGTTLRGMANEVLPAILPPLVSLTAGLHEVNPEVISIGAGIAGIAAAVAIAAPALTTLIKGVSLLYTQLALIAALPAGVLGLATGAYFASTSPVGAGEDALVHRLRAAGTDALGPMAPGTSDSIGTGPGSYSDLAQMFGISAVGGGQSAAPDFKPIITDAKAAADALKAANDNAKMFKDMMADVADVLGDADDPFKELQSNLDKLGALLNAGQISWEQYAAASQRANLIATSSTLDSIGQITGVLAGAFQDNKAIAVANAVVNTAEGVTKALAQGGFLGFAMAGAVAAAGAVQVANILSSQPGSASVAGAGSGATPAAGAPAPTAAAPAAQSITVQLVGGGRYSRSEIEELIKDINSALGDGVKLNIAA